MSKNFIETHAKILKGEEPIFEILLPKTKDKVEIYSNGNFEIILNGETPKFQSSIIVKNKVYVLVSELIKQLNRKKIFCHPKDAQRLLSSASGKGKLNICQEKFEQAGKS